MFNLKKKILEILKVFFFDSQALYWVWSDYLLGLKKKINRFLVNFYWKSFIF